MIVRKTNKSIGCINSGVLYRSGYNVILTREELNELINHLVNIKQKATEEINTWLRDNLTTKLNFGYNYIGTTTFKVIEEYLVENSNNRYKTSNNRYFNFIITDLVKNKNQILRYKDFETGQEVVTKQAKKFNGSEIRRGQSFIITDFYKNIRKDISIRAIDKFNHDKVVYFLYNELDKL